MGWITYAVFLWMSRVGELNPASPVRQAVTGAEFVVAMTLFATAAVLSTHARKVLTAILAVSGVLVACAVLRPIYVPDSGAMKIVVEAGCRLIALSAAIALIRYRIGRLGLGPLLISLGLLTVNLSWPPYTNSVPHAGWVLMEVLFILSIFINLGMWFERFVIVIPSLSHEFEPWQWGSYRPTFVDYSILLGSFGWFFMWFLLFIKQLPVMAMSEVKEVIPPKMRFEHISNHELTEGIVHPDETGATH